MNPEDQEDGYFTPAVDENQPKVNITIYFRGGNGPRTFTLYRDGMSNYEWRSVFSPMFDDTEFTDLDGTVAYIKNDEVSAVIVSDA